MPSQNSEKLILSLMIRNESDVVLARKRARQVALLLGFDAADQTRISTAVSEIVRNAFVHANGGKLEFSLQDAKPPYAFTIVMTDKGKGIQNLEEVLSGYSNYIGLRGAIKLVDKSNIESNEHGTKIKLEKSLAPRLPFAAAELDGIANSLTRLISTNPADEVHQQNQELLLALEQLSETKAQLAQANAELQESNSDLTALNHQMRDWNIVLEEKVEQRTTELQSSNQALLAARDEAVMANNLKTQFVTNMSHEIRTPMAGILGLAEWLTLSEIEGESKEIADHILKSAQHLLAIVNDLLDFSKLSAGQLILKRNEFYLSSIFDEVVQSVYLQARKKNLEITDSVAPEVAEQYWGDGQRLKQVLLNLAHNAVKFTDEGQIHLGASLKFNDLKRPIIRIEVVDDGIGISEANQTKLFQPFVQVDGTSTRKHGGTGLGLAISRSIVEQMGGNIGCESKPGQGSVFYLEVPLERAS